MDAEMFNELLESVRQGKDILKGERTASRRFYVNEINVSQLRSRFELTQNKLWLAYQSGCRTCEQ